MSHFVEKIETIPQRDDPTFKKIMQIALNVGQLIGAGGACPYVRMSDFINPNEDISNKDYKTMHIALSILIEKNIYAQPTI